MQNFEKTNNRKTKKKIYILKGQENVENKQYKNSTIKIKNIM